MRPEYAEIVRSDGLRYRLTEADVLWAARSAAYEGGDTPAGLWTTTQRFMLPAMQHAYPTFTDFIRAFSAPISAKWARGGPMCGEGGPYADKPECAEHILARRDEAARITWDELTVRFPYVVKLASEWATARLSNPVPRATNFAAPSLARDYLARHPGASVALKAGNWYLVEPAAAGWDRNHVTLAYGLRIAGAKPRWPWLLGLIAVAAGGYYVVRWWGFK